MKIKPISNKLKATIREGDVLAVVDKLGTRATLVVDSITEYGVSCSVSTGNLAFAVVNADGEVMPQWETPDA